MLRTSDKRLFVGDRLGTLLGGLSAATPPVSGYSGWWDAKKAHTITVTGSGVSQWDDLSGNGFHLTQGTDANRPAYGARSINGITVPEFNGTSHLLVSNHLVDDRTASHFIVALSDSTSGIHTLIGPNASGGLSFFTTGTNLRADVTGTITIADYAAGVSTSASFVTALILDTNVGTIHFNSNSEQDSNSSGFTAGRTMEIGRADGFDGYWDGLIAEIISYPVTLSSGDVTATKNYLKDKWGTP